MPELYYLPVGRARVAVLDAADARVAVGWNWTWDKNHGVIGRCDGQQILLHQMVSPHSRTRFVDGDRLNCRRSNLAPHITRIPPESNYRRKSKHGNLYDHKAEQRYVFNRKVSHEGEVFMWATSRSYKHRGKAAALKLARQLAREIMQLSRESFISFVRWTRGKKTTAEIISTWTAFEGACGSWDELKYMKAFRQS